MAFAVWAGAAAFAAQFRAGASSRNGPPTFGRCRVRLIPPFAKCPISDTLFPDGENGRAPLTGVLSRWPNPDAAKRPGKSRTTGLIQMDADYPAGRGDQEKGLSRKPEFIGIVLSAGISHVCGVKFLQLRFSAILSRIQKHCLSA